MSNAIKKCFFSFKSRSKQKVLKFKLCESGQYLRWLDNNQNILWYYCFYVYSMIHWKANFIEQEVNSKLLFLTFFSNPLNAFSLCSFNEPIICFHESWKCESFHNVLNFKTLKRCFLHWQYIRINKQSQFRVKNS